MRRAFVRAWDAVKRAFVRAWDATRGAVGWAYRRGVVRPAFQLLLVLYSGALTAQGHYDHATLAVSWVILLEVSDPRRSAGVRVRRKP